MNEWYFIVFGLDGPYSGGFYLGKLTCPHDYPKKAPNVLIMIENGIY